VRFLLKGTALSSKSKVVAVLGAIYASQRVQNMFKRTRTYIAIFAKSAESAENDVGFRLKLTSLLYRCWEGY
jgi:hypothetical protein